MNNVLKRTTGQVARGSTDLALPIIPDLDGDSLDLEKLGSAPLTTYIKYADIKLGDILVPQFYGCAASGEVVDRERLPITIQALEPDGSYKLYLDNHLLVRLDKGFAFYSYLVQVDPRTDPGMQALEQQSLRLFFYVNKQVAPVELLPPAHFTDSDGLVIDLNRVTGDGIVVTGAYAAMSARDEVSLVWKDAYSTDDLRKTLTQADLGKPLEWRIDQNWLLLAGDWAELSWSITYADGGPTSVSPVQRFTILQGNPVQLPSLPPPRVPDEGGGLIDPDGFPDGLPVEVDDYGARYADELLLQAQSEDGKRHRTTVRLERTLLDSGRLRFVLPAPWLQANSGQQVALTWQWARAGAAEDSEPLELTLRKPLNLLLPVIDDVTPQEPEPPEVPDPDIEDYGYVLPIRLIQGAYVNVPASSETGGAKVTVHWDGFGTTGKYSTNAPTVGNNLRYFIPTMAVPANLGKRLKVYYDVELPGRAVQRSPIYGLKINDLESSSFGPIQCPEAPNGVLSLARVSDAVTFVLTSDSWLFFAQGQIVRVRVTGKSQAGQPSLPPEVIRDDEPVSEDEWYDGQLIMRLSRHFLDKIELNTHIQVSVWVSFDEGANFTSTIPVDLLVQA